MTNGSDDGPRFTRAAAAASGFFLGTGAFTLGLGLGWFGPGLDGSPLVRAITVAEGVFLLGLGVFLPTLWALSRHRWRLRSHAADDPNRLPALARQFTLSDKLR